MRAYLATPRSIHTVRQYVVSRKDAGSCMNEGGALTRQEPGFPKCADPYCEDEGYEHCGTPHQGAGTGSTPDARVAIANADQVSGAVSARSETCEEHLGNALAIVRAAKQQNRTLDLEAFATVYRRIEAARRELVALNI